MSSESERPRPWTPASLRELGAGFQASRVLLTAVELRVFSLIGNEGLASSDLAARAGCHPRVLNRLVAADGGDTFTEEEIRSWLTAAGLSGIERRQTPFGADLMLAQKPGSRTVPRRAE